MAKQVTIPGRGFENLVFEGSTIRCQGCGNEWTMPDDQSVECPNCAGDVVVLVVGGPGSVPSGDIRHLYGPRPKFDVGP